MMDAKPSCSYRVLSSSEEENEEIDSDLDNKRVAKKAKYSQNYNFQWEKIPEMKGWLKKSQKGEYFAYCNACHVDINIKSEKIQLYRHADRDKHKQACSTKLKQKSMFDMLPTSIDTQVKNAELTLAAFVIEHNLPMTLMDHVPDMLRTVCPDSQIAKSIKAARTKTTKIIENVMGVYSFQKLVDVLKVRKFSLIIDASTDMSTVKHLCLVARVIFNNNISDCFLSLLPVESAQAEVLFQQIINFFDKNHIPYLNNLIGFAADGASNMMGRHNSVASRFLTANPEVFILKCVCHSFALCASNACEKLPDFVETVCRDIYNYFSNSPKRILQLKEFQDFCNIKVHKILHPCQTRWLSVLSVVKRILEQYNALVLFFTDACFNNKNDIHANNILEALKNPVFKLYLQFLDYILPLFINLNRQMQSENPQISNLYATVRSVVSTLLDCFIKKEAFRNVALSDIQYKNPNNMLPLEEMYFGAAVAACSLEIPQLNSLKTNCLSFYIEGVTKILQRFPLKDSRLQDLSFLNPQSVREKNKISIANIAAKWPSLTDANNLQQLDNEWRLLRNLDEYPDTQDVSEFWTKISNLKFGDNNPMFPNLTEFIFNILILPHSSANVERVFSTINLLKTKQRNRLSTETIIGILHSKRLITSTCFNFKGDAEIRKLMTKDIYKE